MATITSSGYDGSVTETVWGQRAPLYGSDPGVAGVNDFTVTLTGPDTISVAPGQAYGRGVVDLLAAATTLTLTRPPTGQRYDAVVLRRDWTTNTTTVVVVPGGTTRTIPPLLDSIDVQDQPLALVMVPAEGGMVLSDDLRLTHAPTGLVRSMAAMRGPIGSRYVLEATGARYTVGVNGPVPDWEPAPRVVPEIPIIACGTAGFATDANGTASIRHGLPWIPDVVIFQPRTAVKSHPVQVTTSTAAGSLNALTMVVNAKVRTETGWKTYVGNLGQVDWTAVKLGPASAPPSTTPVPPPEDTGTDVPVTSGGGKDTVPRDTEAAPAPQIPLPQLPPEYQAAKPTASSVAAIIATAASQIGVKESPAGSNNVKYWLDEKPSWNGQPWCACYTTWVYRRNGIVVTSVLGISNPYYTPDLEAGARAKGLWYTGTPRPGDMVIFGNSKLPYGTVIGTDSNGNKIIAKAQHVEIVEAWDASTGRVQTIGGNTSDGTNGSPNNGGGVFRNRRNPNSASFPVRGYIRMPTSVPVDLRVKGPFPLPSGHYFGVADAASTLDHNGVADNKQGVMQIQAEVGAAVDGEYGPNTETLVKAWQKAQFRTQTGRVYAEDWNVFLGVYTAPARPTGIVATAGDGSATVVFNASSGAQQYSANIYGTNIVKTATASPITFTGLPAGVPVQITVTATNVGGASDTSARSNVVWPTEGGLSTTVLGDGSVIPVWAGSSKQPQLITAVGTSNKDTTTYNAFVGKFPTARWLAGAQQMARNVAAILYGGSAYAPPAARGITFEFTAEARIAYTWSDTGTIVVGRTGATTTANVASWMTHEMVHLIQVSSPLYGSNTQVTGLIEGIADYCLIVMGHHGPDQRPAGGGSSWYAGYDTTGFFLDYVESRAPTKSPGFVQRLNQQMRSASWTPAQITSINARGMTVDALWTEYKAWAARL